MDLKLLRRLARDVDERHREAMRSIEGDLEATWSGDTAAGFARSRRGFLRDAALGGAVLTVGSVALPVSGLVGVAAAAPAQDGMVEAATDADRELAAWAQSVELAAVAAYRLAIDLGRLGEPARTVAETFMGHHRDHAGSWSGFAGKVARGRANAGIVEQFEPLLRRASNTSEAAVLEVAFTLENAAASTYLLALGVFESIDGSRRAASILPVEAQHAAVLGQVLGKDLADYSPSFETTADAITPSAYPL